MRVLHKNKTKTKKSEKIDNKSPLTMATCVFYTTNGKRLTIRFPCSSSRWLFHCCLSATADVQPEHSIPTPSLEKDVVNQRLAFATDVVTEALQAMYFSTVRGCIQPLGCILGEDEVLKDARQGASVPAQLRWKTFSCRQWVICFPRFAFCFAQPITHHTHSQNLHESPIDFTQNIDFPFYSISIGPP